MTHLIPLRGVTDSDFIEPDFWEVHEWDGLNELGFKSDGSYKMAFEYEDDKNNEDRTLKIVAYKKKDGWYVECEKNGKREPTLRFNRNGSMMNHIHDIFEKF